MEDPKQGISKGINKSTDIDNKTELLYYHIWIRILEFLHFFPLSQSCYYPVSVEMKLGIFSNLFLNGMFFLIQGLLLTFVKFHNYVYSSYSDTSPMLSSLLTAFSFDSHMPSNWVNFLVLIHFLVGWNTSLSNFFRTDNWVAYFLSHFMSEKVLCPH